MALGAWAIARQDRPAPRDWLPLAIGMAGIVQSHLLTTELAALFLALFWLCNLPVMVRPARLLAACKAVAVAVGLSCWFLLPCLQTLQSQKIMISDVHPSPLQSTGTYLIQLLGFFGTAGGSSGPGTTGDMPLTIGLAGCVVLVLALWCCVRRGAWQHTLRKAATAGWVAGQPGALPAGSVAVHHAFPWDWLANKLPQTLVDILLKPQFSWRYLAVAVVLLGVITVTALQLAESAAPRLAQGMAIAVVAATLLYVGVFYSEYAYRQDTITLISTETVTDFPYETMGYDYLPAGADFATFASSEASAENPGGDGLLAGERRAGMREPVGTGGCCGPAAAGLPALHRCGYRHRADAAADGRMNPIACRSRCRPGTGGLCRYAIRRRCSGTGRKRSPW